MISNPRWFIGSAKRNEKIDEAVEFLLKEVVAEQERAEAKRTGRSMSRGFGRGKTVNLRQGDQDDSEKSKDCSLL